MGKLLLTKLIRLYQVTLSPWLGRQCRFYPTCSHYAMEAIDTHGAAVGTKLTIKRLVKCQPFHPGGVDLVPHTTQTCAEEQNHQHLTS